VTITLLPRTSNVLGLGYPPFIDPLASGSTALLKIKEAQSGAATNNSVTLTLGTNTSAGDLLLIFNHNDWYNAASIPNPTSSQTLSNLTLQATADSGTNSPHIKFWTAFTTVNGVQTVTGAPVSDEEITFHVIVIDGKTVNSFDFLDGSTATNSGTSSILHVAPSVSSTTINSLLVSAVGSASTAGAAANYTSPAGMIEQTDVREPSFQALGSIASEQLVTSGATGTKTFTLNGTAQAFAAISVAIKWVGDVNSGTVTQAITANAEVIGSVTSDVPVLVQSAQSVWNTTTSPKTVTLTTQANDVIIVMAISDSGRTWSVPTGNSVTFALEKSYTDANSACVYLWSATDSAGGTNWTLSVAATAGSTQWGIVAYVFRYSSGPGVSGITGGQTTGLPSQALTTGMDKSAIVAGVGDWSAQAITSRTWKTINSVTPTAGNGLEKVASQQVSLYTAYSAYWDNVGTAGSKTAGMDAPSGMTWTIAAIEVKPVATSAKTGAVTQTITAGSSVVGVVATSGAVTQAIIAGFSVVGVVATSGAVTQAITAGFSVVGVSGAVGAVTQAITAGFSVIGSVGGAQPQGQVTQTLTAVSAVVGTVQTFGAVTSVYTAGSSVVGVVAKTGAVTATETAVSTVVGSVVAGVTGSVTAVETAASTVVGVVAVFGAVTQTLTAASTVIGVVNRSGVVTASVAAGFSVVGSTVAGVIGQVTQTITTGATVVGLRGSVGAASVAIAAGSVVTGRVDATGTVIITVQGVYTVAAVRATSATVGSSISSNVLATAFVVGTYGYSRIGVGVTGGPFSIIDDSGGPSSVIDDSDRNVSFGVVGEGVN